MTSLWDRTDITVFIDTFSDPGELGTFFTELKKLCPKATRRGYANLPMYQSPRSVLCLGWSDDPLYTSSYGGEQPWDKIWEHREFLDHVGYNRQ